MLLFLKDDASIYFHTPNKTLIYVVHIPDNDSLLYQQGVYGLFIGG